jgi:nucleoid DNA-binding protein
MAFDSLPKDIQRHLRGLAAEQGRDSDPAFLDALASVWSRKAELFVSYAEQNGLELIRALESGDGRGFLALSWSGSLLSVGPDNDDTGGKWMEYSSIKLRTDVPDMVVDRPIGIDGAVQLGSSVSFFNARVASTSPIQYLAACPEGTPTDEQDRMIREGSIFITTGFMKFNRSLIQDRENIPDQFTMKSMTRYLAKKHGLTGNESRLIIDDFLTLVETGMLLGESVPMGRVGRFFVKIRDAQKPRTVKHPATGEEMTIEAKPAMGVPKISFSSYLKERVAGLGAGNALPGSGEDDRSAD